MNEQTTLCFCTQTCQLKCFDNKIYFRLSWNNPPSPCLRVVHVQTEPLNNKTKKHQKMEKKIATALSAISSETIKYLKISVYFSKAYTKNIQHFAEKNMIRWQEREQERGREREAFLNRIMWVLAPRNDASNIVHLLSFPPSPSIPLSLSPPSLSIPLPLYVTVRAPLWSFLVSVWRSHKFDWRMRERER